MALAQTDDLCVLQQQVELCPDPQGQPTDQVACLWFENEEVEAGQTYHLYRAVNLFAVAALPLDKRQDVAYLDRMRTVLAALYVQHRGAFDLVQLLAGVWEPTPLGVLQIYGVVGWGPDAAAARERAAQGSQVFQATLEGAFPQIRLEPLTTAQLHHLLEAYERYTRVSVFVGQPDERLASKGHGRQGATDPQQGLPAELGVTGQQLELFTRALTAQRIPFLAAWYLSPIPPAHLAHRLDAVAGEASVPASLQSGAFVASAGIAMGMAVNAQLANMASSAFGEQQSRTYSQSLALSEGRAQTTGRAVTTTHSVSEGSAHTVGSATSSGVSRSQVISLSTGTADTLGSATTQGTSESTGTSHTTSSSQSTGSSHTSGSFSSSGVSHGVSGGAVQTVSSGLAHTVGNAQGATTARMHGTTFGTTTTANDNWSNAQNTGVTNGVSETASVTGGVSAGIPGVIGASGSATVGGAVSRNVIEGASAGVGGGVSVADSNATTVGGSHAVSNVDSTAATTSDGVSNAVSSGWSFGMTAASGSSSSSTSSSSQSTGVADTVSHSTGTSQATSQSQANTQSQGLTITEGVAYSSSSTASESHTTSRAETWSSGTTVSNSDTVSSGVSRGVSSARSSGVSVGRSLGVSQGFGVGLSIAPNFSIADTYQWFDDQAIQLTQLLRTQELLYQTATLEGAYLTDFYVLTPSESSAAVVEAAARAAFQGISPLVVTPVQPRRLTPEEQAYLKVHARAFTPATRREPDSATFETYRHSTTLLPRQAAAYLAPALFEEGFASTAIEKIPPIYGFFPDLRGAVLWAHQYSAETGKLTQTPVRFGREQLFHTLIAGDTGFGKSVAAERLLLETTRAFHTRTVVLDFGAGWRKLIHAPGLENRVAVYQLQPGGVLPFRWNMWQVGQRIRPERQLEATCELIRNAGRMGERQLGYMRRAAKQMWTEAGVLVFSREVLDHAQWGVVQADEWPVLAALSGRAPHLPPRAPARRVSLRTLDPAERQALAVYRSQRTGIPQWLTLLRAAAQALQHPTEKTSLEGLILRLEAFEAGELLEMYGPGPDALAIEDLGLLGPPDDAWGVTVLEGGAEMDQFLQIVLLGLVAWHSYSDAVVRRRERLNTGAPEQITQIYLEEANKIFTGVQTDASDKGAGPSALWPPMFRDGRKYGIFLIVIVQTPSELPDGIASSCNNIVVCQLKHPQDRDLLMSQLAFSEKGFADEDIKRHLSRLPQKRAVIKLGFIDDPRYAAPMLTRPILVPAREPTDQELLAHHALLRSHP